MRRVFVRFSAVAAVLIVVVLFALLNGFRLRGVRYSLEPNGDGRWGIRSVDVIGRTVDADDPNWRPGSDTGVNRPEGIDAVPRPRTEYGPDGKPIPAPTDLQSFPDQ